MEIVSILKFMINNLKSFIHDYNNPLIYCILMAIVFFTISGYLGKFFNSEGRILNSGFKYEELQFGGDDDNSLIINIQYNIFGPNIFMLLTACIIDALDNELLLKNNFYIVPCYFLIRAISIIFVFRKAKLFNYKYELLIALISTGVAMLINKALIMTDKGLLPTVEEFRTQLWLVFFALCYSFLVKTVGKSTSIQQDNICTKEMKKEYISKRYKVLKKKYGEIVEMEVSEEYLRSIVYAIMIFEDFNRTKFHRCLEYILFAMGKRPMTLGVMQYKTLNYISESSSVEKGCKKIVQAFKIYLKTQIDDGEFIENNFETENLEDALIWICNDYNSGEGYVNNIIFIYRELPGNEIEYREEVQRFISEYFIVNEFAVTKNVYNKTQQIEQIKMAKIETVNAFVNLINSNLSLIWSEGEFNVLNFDDESEFVIKESVYDGKEFIINNINNFIMEGSNTKLVVEPRYASVITFRNCDNLVIRNFTIGHSNNPGSCVGTVLRLENCNNVNLELLELYGCGTYGVDIDKCSNIIINGCKIYECTQGALNIRSSDVTIENSMIFNCMNLFSNLIEMENSLLNISNLSIFNNSMKNYIFHFNNSKIDYDGINIHDNIYKEISNQKIENGNMFIINNIEISEDLL